MVSISTINNQAVPIEAGYFVNLARWKTGFWAEVEKVTRQTPNEPAFIYFWAHQNPDPLFLEKTARFIREFTYESQKLTIRDVSDKIPADVLVYQKHQVIWHGNPINSLPANWNLSLRYI